MEFLGGLAILAGLGFLAYRTFSRVFGTPVVCGSIEPTGRCALAAVGESHYQPALRAVAGPGEVRHYCRATLVLESDNRYDKHAVRVDVEGRTVAYLSHDDAPRYRKQIARYGNLQAECDAVIVGGGPSRSLGIWLDVPTLDDES